MLALQESWKEGPSLNYLNMTELDGQNPLEESKIEECNFTLSLIKIESPEKPLNKSVRRSKAQRNYEASANRITSNK